MVILRKVFSETEKKIDKEDVKNIATSGGILAGAYTTTKLSKKAGEKIYDKLVNSRNNSEDAEKVRKLLVQEAKKKGADIRSTNINNSVYTGRSKLARKFTKKYLDFIKRLQKKGVPIEELDPEMEKIINSIGKDKVFLGKGSLRDVDSLAHELGHRHHSSKESKGIGRLSHATRTGSVYAMAATPIAGFVSGMRSAKKAHEGEEEGIVNKHIAWALPAATSANVLTAEAAASHKGMKDMKRLGANKATQALAKKRLGAALGTYAMNAAVPAIAMGVGSRQAGKLLGRAMYGKPKEKDEDKSKNKDKKKGNGE